MNRAEQIEAEATALVVYSDIGGPDWDNWEHLFDALRAALALPAEAAPAAAQPPRYEGRMGCRAGAAQPQAEGAPGAPTDPREAMRFGAALAYRERGMDPEASYDRADWLMRQFESGRTDPAYVWERDPLAAAPHPQTAPRPSTDKEGAP